FLLFAFLFHALRRVTVFFYFLVDVLVFFLRVARGERLAIFGNRAVNLMAVDEKFFLVFGMFLLYVAVGVQFVLLRVELAEIIFPLREGFLFGGQSARDEFVDIGQRGFGNAWLGGVLRLG